MTVDEVREENARFLEEAQAEQDEAFVLSSEGEDPAAAMEQVEGDASYADDVHWDEWVDAAECAV